MKLLLLLITYTFAAKISSLRTHTKIYDELKDGTFTGTIYLPNTYGGLLHEDICQKISRKKYIKLLDQNNVKCTGDWCINNTFSCSKQPCYNMEHIIDLENSLPNITKEDKNILGNVVMAYSKWNIQVGNLKWNDVEIEKREIYGNYMVDKAIETIIYCKDNNFIETVESSEDYQDTANIEYTTISITKEILDDNLFILAIFIIGFLIGFVLPFVCLCLMMVKVYRQILTDNSSI